MLLPMAQSEEEASRKGLSNAAALWRAGLQTWSMQEGFHRSRLLPWQVVELSSAVPWTLVDARGVE